MATNRLWLKAMVDRTAQPVLDFIKKLYNDEKELVDELQMAGVKLRAHTDNGKEFSTANLSEFLLSLSKNKL